MGLKPTKIPAHGTEFISALAPLAVLSLFLMASFSAAYASPPAQLERQLSQIFNNHSFTIRNFYQGKQLSYDSSGALLTSAQPGYWSRNGMVLISSVKLQPDDELVMRGKRYSVEFDPASGEFNNVKTGDKVEILIRLQPDQLNLQASIPVLQKVFVTSHEKLADIAPSYWRNCLSYRVTRRSKKALWSCVAADPSQVPGIAGKKLVWDIPPPDNSLRDGTQLYLLRHRVAYIGEPGVSPPELQVAPDPVFRWEQRRVSLEDLTCVLSIRVGEDGKAHDIFIVTPVGMGLDDDAVAALRQWRFRPARRDGKPVPAHARVIFVVSGGDRMSLQSAIN